MECEFTASVEVLNVAVPLELRGRVANAVEPSLKVTVPVGVPAPGATTLTAAVKVTDWPVVEGFADELRMVAVEALFTVWARDREIVLEGQGVGWVAA